MKIGTEIYAMLEDKGQVSAGEFMPISFDKEIICCYNCDDKNQKILFLPAEMFFEDVEEVHDNINKMRGRALIGFLLAKYKIFIRMLTHFTNKFVVEHIRNKSNNH